MEVEAAPLRRPKPPGRAHEAATAAAIARFDGSARYCRLAIRGQLDNDVRLAGVRGALDRPRQAREGATEASR